MDSEPLVRRRIKKPPSSNIHVGLPQDQLERLYHAGMPRSLHKVRPFDTEDYLTTIVSEVDSEKQVGPRRRSINIPRQVEYLRMMLHTRVASPYVACIAEPYADSRAKLLASHILGNYIEHKPGHMPLWHTVLGMFKDRLRDKSVQRKPDFLVISNVAENSSHTKIELVKDILTMYDNIPRIVVLGGSDPIKFFAEVLHCELNYAVLLSPTQRKSL